jgi:hypothetical protein
MANVYNTNWVRQDEELKKSYEDSINIHQQTHAEIKNNENARIKEHAEALKDASKRMAERISEAHRWHAKTHADIDRQHANSKREFEEGMKRSTNDHQRRYHQDRYNMFQDAFAERRKEADGNLKSAKELHAEDFGRIKAHHDEKLKMFGDYYKNKRAEADERLKWAKGYYGDKSSSSQQKQQQQQQRSYQDTGNRQQYQSQQQTPPPRQQPVKPKENMPEGFNFNFNAAPHEMLGIKPGATRSEVMSGYKNAMRRYHPDVNPAEHSALYTRAAQAINGAKDRALRGLAKALIDALVEALNKSRAKKTNNDQWSI